MPSEMVWKNILGQKTAHVQRRGPIKTWNIAILQGDAEPTLIRNNCKSTNKKLLQKQNPTK